MTDAPIPWLPEGRTAVLAGRGEVFYRRHVHADSDAPTLILLHGWTASADLQFFTAYQALAERFSFIAIDHRGHGRGMRPTTPFTLEDAADDAAALAETLGIDTAIAVGYSMGGPIALHLAYRHPALVAGLVLEATALEWRGKRVERLRWKTVRLLGPLLRSWAYPTWLRWGIRRLTAEQAEIARYAGWLAGESGRNEALAIVQAGQALSRYDARPWAGGLGIPAGVLVTTRDRLVKPVKQRALASALDADVVALAGDHLCSLVQPDEFAACTVQLADKVAGRAGLHAGSAVAT